jgi:dihydroorotate dehydrogenase electron transfer subunit
MVKPQTATFRFAHPAPPNWAVRFDAAHLPDAGQFVLADMGGPLREVLFPSLIDDTGFAVMVAPGHAATRLLPGSEVDLIGPTGHGFRVNDAQRLLLVAEAERLPVLLPLLNAAPSVALVIEGTTRARLPAPDSIPPAIELTLVTLDGSIGYLGPLESTEPAPTGLERVGSYLYELIAWTECVCFACSRERYPALADLVRQARIQPTKDFAQAFVRVEMPCGVGACDVCRITTRRGEKRVCTDGPVFDLLELE